MRSRVFLAIFVSVLAPIATVVLISALLLFHVEPRWVFAPGLAIRSLANGPRQVAVAGTAAVYWAIIALIGILWDRRRRMDA